ncbi:phospholipase D-like domain-containing protein [Aeromicrobium sp. Root344]|uniref:phospholipase D-like domain-containing protein n=1 Tax=Aeromicrobium sp. Root344 TaxID=1736521 RepID=UPI000A54E852|nr:phospholipase D-like domain-containing protein [Aeromicrobium sp. Root344]
MRMRRPSTRGILKRALFTMLSAQFLIVVALMVTTKVRKLMRGSKSHDTFPVTPPAPLEVGAGNTATVYTYGSDLFEDMLAAIGNARERILFETYIIKADEMGRRFKQALVDAAERGVDVYVIYDGFANLVVTPSFLTFPAPIHVLRYPVFATGWRFFSPRQMGRDHRKVLVVDDEVGYVGGYNIGSLYASEWRDTHLKIEGPSVWDLDNAFVDFWNLRRRRRARMLKERGDASWEPQIRAHRNVPRQLLFPIRGMYIEAIDRARDHIYITAAYFIPDRDILDGLLAAAARGVRVRILVPEISNHVVADWLSRGFYSQLLDGGVEILLYQDWMVHAKTATIDGRWTTIGTANIDRLSLTGNYEINLEILDDALAQHLETVFETDASNARVLTRAEWSSRPLVAKACEWILAPLRPLL